MGKDAQPPPPEELIHSLLPDLAVRLRADAQRTGRSAEKRAIELVDSCLAPALYDAPGADEDGLRLLSELLRQIPAIGRVQTSEPGERFWWVQFSIRLDHALAWHVIQNLAFVANYISLEERLAVVFKPISPPPYLNGGPADFLS